MVKKLLAIAEYTKHVNLYLFSGAKLPRNYLREQARECATSRSIGFGYQREGIFQTLEASSESPKALKIAGKSAFLRPIILGKFFTAILTKSDGILLRIPEEKGFNSLVFNCIDKAMKSLGERRRHCQSFTKSRRNFISQERNLSLRPLGIHQLPRRISR